MKQTNTPLPLLDPLPIPQPGEVERPYTPPPVDTSFFGRVKKLWSDVVFWLTAPTWKIVVLCLDGIDEGDQMARPLKEVERFLRINSRFRLVITKKLTFNDTHPYSGPFDGKYCLHWPELPQKWRDQIPDNCHQVMVLYKLNGRQPLQLGSTWPLAQGIPVHGKLHIFTSIWVDNPWFVNDPYEGFNCRSGQIATHETDNGITEVANKTYGCIVTLPPSQPAWEYERQKIALDDGCYKRIGSNPD